MRFTGQFESIEAMYPTKIHRITLLINEDVTDLYEELKYSELDIEINKYRKKRSLDANSYYWVLLTKLAKVLDTSLPELHNRMLCHYGYPEIIDGKAVLVPLQETEETEKNVRKSEYYHLKPTSQVTTMADGNLWRTYMLIRGSSTYNTEEMASLIRGLISDCKDAKIPDREIATPDEKRLLKEKYHVEL